MTRLSKWYVTPPEESEQRKLEAGVNRTIILRDKNHTNFVEYENMKIIYRRYAGLFFVFGMEVDDNELLLMETIHLFVELMDQFFSNVWELDIVFHFNKVYALLDEFIIAGEVQETSKKVILDRMKELEKTEWVIFLLLNPKFQIDDDVIKTMKTNSSQCHKCWDHAIPPSTTILRVSRYSGLATFYILSPRESREIFGQNLRIWYRMSARGNLQLQLQLVQTVPVTVKKSCLSYY